MPTNREIEAAASAIVEFITSGNTYTQKGDMFSTEIGMFKPRDMAKAALKAAEAAKEINND